MPAGSMPPHRPPPQPARTGRPPRILRRSGAPAPSTPTRPPQPGRHTARPPPQRAEGQRQRQAGGNEQDEMQPCIRARLPRQPAGRRRRQAEPRRQPDHGERGACQAARPRSVPSRAAEKIPRRVAGDRKRDQAVYADGPRAGKRSLIRDGRTTATPRSASEETVSLPPRRPGGAAPRARSAGRAGAPRCTLPGDRGLRHGKERVDLPVDEAQGGGLHSRPAIAVDPLLSATTTRSREWTL